MGIYFIAAGKSSKNRKKSLDKSFDLNELKPYLSQEVYEKLKTHYGPNDPIYVWGANEGSRKDLNKIQEGEFAVDVKNKEVMNVFEFCFWYKTPDTRLQNYIGWDAEKPVEEQRPYLYVYFLKNPQKPNNIAKSYYRNAFGYDNPYWLPGQKYFDNIEVNKALNRKEVKSVEEFLGIRKSVKPKTKKFTSKVSEEETNYQNFESSRDKKSNQKSFWSAFWEWIKAFPGFGER